MDPTPRDLTYLRAPAEMHPVAACPWCARAAGEHLVTRGDGLPVHRCAACRFTYLAALPEDISVFYDDEYFGRSDESGQAPTGYDDYDASYTPASFLWLAELARTVAGGEPTSVFDLGAATGTFLEAARFLGFRGAGVELTETGAARARAKGLTVVTGMLEPADWADTTFDIVTALEVLEHVTDLRSTLIDLAGLLSPTGALVFLVPNVDEETLTRYGADALDFHTSYEHTVYFDPTSLRTVTDELFGEGSLSLFTTRVTEQGQAIGIAVGVIRLDPSADRPERVVFDVLSGNRVTAELETPAQALTVALTAAKFYQPHLADEALERARELGAASVELAVAGAQVIRNRGELHAAIAALDPIVIGPPVPLQTLANHLVIDLIGEVLGFRGIDPANLAAAIGTMDARLIEADEMVHELDATRSQLNEAAAGRVNAETRASALERTVERETAKVEELGRRLETREREISQLEGRVRAASARAISLGDENLRLRADLNAIYSSRGWRALAAMRRLKGGSRALGTEAPASSPDAAAQPPPRPPVDCDVTVSVIMPVYNKGRAVLESISSVKTQTFGDTEIVMWDDGSTDEETITALREAENLERVRVHRARNRGVVSARNQAMGEARGEFFMCLDADDRIRPTYLEKAVALLRSQPNVSIVYPWQRSFGGRDELWETSDLDRLRIATVNHVPVCAVFRREVFEQTGGFSNRMADGFEDWEFWAHAAELGFEGKAIPEPLFEYYWSADASESRDATARTKHSELAGRIATLHPTLTDPALDAVRFRAPDRVAFQVPVFPLGEAGPIVLTMPWFTVGGADRVVEQLIRHWTGQGRTVVAVTTHEVGAGMTDRLADLLTLTPYAYHLPNLMPEHLWIEFFGSLLVGLPGATLFNVGAPWLRAHAAEIDRRWPGTPIIDQQFNDSAHVASNLAAGPALTTTVVAYDGLRSAFLAEPSRSEDDVTTIYIGIDPLVEPAAGAVTDLRSAATIPEDVPYVVFVGRLAEEKRPGWLLPLADHLYSRDTMLLVVGNGPLGEELGDDFDGHPGIRWLEEVDDVAPVYSGASAMVLASETEGIPLTLMEALSMGTPVIATAVGGIPELADVPGVRVTDPNDRSAWIDAVLDTLASPPVSVRLPDHLTAAAMLNAYDGLLSRIESNQGSKNRAR